MAQRPLALALVPGGAGGAAAGSMVAGRHGSFAADGEAPSQTGRRRTDGRRPVTGRPRTRAGAVSSRDTTWWRPGRGRCDDARPARSRQPVIPEGTAAGDGPASSLARPADRRCRPARRVTPAGRGARPQRCVGRAPARAARVSLEHGRVEAPATVGPWQAAGGSSGDGSPRRSSADLRWLTATTFRICLKHRVTGLAAEIGFFALLSLPPLVLGLAGTLGYFADVIGAGHRRALPQLRHRPGPARAVRPDRGRHDHPDAQRRRSTAAGSTSSRWVSCWPCGPARER